MKLIIDIPEDLYKWIKDEYDNPNEEVAYSAIENGIPVSTEGDLISREALKETVELEEGIFWDSYFPDELVIRKKYIDNAPTVVNEYTKGFADGERSGRNFPLTDEEKAILVRQWRPQGDLADEVWKLYEKYHSHLATHVIEFGDELKDLLGKYQKDGAE